VLADVGEVRRQQVIDRRANEGLVPQAQEFLELGQHQGRVGAHRSFGHGGGSSSRVGQIEAAKPITR
jgi:hypothetical protein